MQASDKAAFAVMIAAIYEFHSKEPSEAVLSMWWGTLQEYDLAAVREAFNRHFKNPDTGQFIPKPADVVRMLGGSTLDSALVAWTKVQSAMERVGGYKTVVFDDPLVHAVLEEMGGWVLLCSKTTMKELPFKQNEFVNRYRGYRMRGLTPLYAPKLVGIFDGENEGNGWPVDDRNTVLIGDQKACLTVLAGGSNVPRLPMKPIASAVREAAALLENKG